MKFAVLAFLAWRDFHEDLVLIDEGLDVWEFVLQVFLSRLLPFLISFLLFD
jgi:hypothetical protein